MCADDTLQESSRTFYLNASVWILGLWQIIATINFTAVQLLLPLYLGDYLHIDMTYVGIIVSTFFLFWFLISPFAGILSDTFGRRLFIYLASFLSAVGQIGLSIFTDPFSLFFSNAIVGLGSSLGAGSAVALWIGNVPENKTTESLGYYNILLTLGGIVGAVGGALIFETLIGKIFLVFAILRVLTVIPIFYVSEKQAYQKLSIKNIVTTLTSREYSGVYFSRDVLRVYIHWITFSAVVGIGGYVFTIVNRIAGVNIPPTSIELGVVVLGIPFVLLLPIWGRLADRRGNRQILLIGLSGTTILILYLFVLIRLGIAKSILLDLIFYSNLSKIPSYLPALGPLLLVLATTAAVIPTSMSWIVERINDEDLAKVLSIRRALIGIGTILGSFIAGATLGLFDVSILFIVLALLVLISAIILL